jgi:cell wall-associated NlpC family hydrolase
MRSEFIAAARACVETPFRHQGRVPGRALDCVGLVVCAARAVGIQVIDDITYPHEPSEKHLRGMLAMNQLRSCAFDDDQVADLLLMRYSAQATHVAIRTEVGILHAYAPERRVVEVPFDDGLRALVAGRFRFPWQS